VKRSGSNEILLIDIDRFRALQRKRETDRDHDEIIDFIC
jgi:hypothetical protein